MSKLSGRGRLTGVMRSGGGSGGGSEVIINPSGAAIGTMEKISVDGDIYEVRNVPDATSASNGDVLTRSASGVGWNPPTKELPTYSELDNGKILSILNGALSWATPSGSDISLIDLSPEDYEELTTEEKNDPTKIYFVHGTTIPTANGSFTSAGTSQGKVKVSTGFLPKTIEVVLPFSNGNTYANYDAEVSDTTSTWYIPMESRTYTITLGSTSGETGISDILSDGFNFRSNAGNTQNVNCTYDAVGFPITENSIYYRGNKY